MYRGSPFLFSEIVCHKRKWNVGIILWITLYGIPLNHVNWIYVMNFLNRPHGSMNNSIFFWTLWELAKLIWHFSGSQMVEYGVPLHHNHRWIWCTNLNEGYSILRASLRYRMIMNICLVLDHDEYAFMWQLMDYSTLWHKLKTPGMYMARSWKW